MAENIIIIIQKGVNIMAQISLRVDDEIKHKAEKTLDEIEELERRVANIRSGKSTLKEHELIEEDE